MESGDADAVLLRRYDALSERFARFGGYDTDVAVNKIVNGLSIPPAQRRQSFDSLSGGEKTRVNLARLILEDTDILLLDEPTNHLDLHAVEWLEEYLESFRGTVLTISHDRYFLDRTVKRILELDGGKAVSYAGNYSAYAVEKERRELEQARRYKREQAEIERLTETARKMHEHNTELLHKRAFSIEKRIERMRTVSRPAQRRKLDARFTAAEFRGDEVLSMRNLSMSYGAKRLFDGISLKIEGGERIALIGDNGAGKSTLLKIIMGEEYPDAGRVRIGPQTRISYLPQVMEFENPAFTLLDTMLSAKRNLSAQSARNRLAAYEFAGEDVFKPVCVLSGGEQSRLRLCMLMDDETNLLILDEPTNHLDIASREWIEDAAEAYDGALLFVSHDRYFINRFATRIWELADGTITDYPMGFAQYRAMKSQEEAEKARQAEEEKAAKAKEKKAVKPTRGGRQQQSAKRQLTICERDIARLEEKIAALDASMEECAADYKKLTELSAEREAAQSELDALYERWEALSEEAEA
ncbi:MAG: ABC-F family ATP-binding cassette domain-containing protein [Oscillibacter sp.]|nr:ABC-F family ATP-binding cassette domain-containing protein [Oscillibacter sp.]